MERTNKTDKKSIKIFTVPNILSMVRLCLIPLLVWLYCFEKNYSAAGIVLIISGATDIVDGFIARHFNTVSDLGKILDPIADKFTQAAILICLVIRFPLMLLPLILLAAKESFMAIIGFIVIRKTGIVTGAFWHGKVATVLLYAMMTLHIFWTKIDPTVSVISIILTCAMIITSFILYGTKYIQILKNTKNVKEDQTSEASA